MRIKNVLYSQQVGDRQTVTTVPYDTVLSDIEKHLGKSNGERFRNMADVCDITEVHLILSEGAPTIRMRIGERYEIAEAPHYKFAEEKLPTNNHTNGSWYLMDRRNGW